MIRLQKLTCTILFSLFFIALNAQTDPYQDVYAGNFTASTTTITTTQAKATSSSKFIQQSYISDAFLNASNGFVGIVFSDEVKQANIYYKIVDERNNEIYNGSVHSNFGSQPTLYYNTQNLPSGNYRIYIENDNFFMSANFTK